MTSHNEIRFVALPEWVHDWDCDLLTRTMKLTPEEAEAEIAARVNDGSGPAEEWHIYEIEVKIAVRQELYRGWHTKAPLASLPEAEEV